MPEAHRVLLVGGRLGSRLAQRAASRGDQVLTVSPIRPTGDTAVPHLNAELRTPAQWVAAVHAGFEQLGGLDVLVNCRGTNFAHARLGKRADDDWHSALRNDVLPLLRSCLAGIELMSGAGGVVVNLTEDRAWPDDLTSAPALASFAALEATTHAVALEAATRRVRAFGVAPQLHARGRLYARGPAGPVLAGEPARPLRFPQVGFVASDAVTGSILDLIANRSAHDATYRLDSGQLPVLYPPVAGGIPAPRDAAS
jgi:NAD(P)-dependent dehydrogenase (short-subunit alcohol dehydrogenase family)